MNEQQEKRRKIKRSTTHDDDDDGSQTNPFPLDLIPEILSRLPAKSLVRYLCVSKLCSSFTKHQSFINSFAARSSERPQLILLTVFANSKTFVFSVPQDGYYPPVESYEMINPQDLSFPRSECVHGLVLLNNGLVIWNPAMRRLIHLPNPTTSNGRNTFLGYDPFECKHKVLHIDISGQARVLTLGGQESWRTITKNIPTGSTFGEGYGRCFNGVLYYSVTFSSTVLEKHLMSFDVRSEKFNGIKIPKGYRYFFPVKYLIPNYEGKLALVDPNISWDSVNLYILEDAYGHVWTYKRLFVPSHRDKSEERTHLQFHGVTDDGELIFAPESLSESFYILYFDPSRNSIREAFFEGIVGDEFRRRYGLGEDIFSQFGIFPTYTESLVSSL